LVLLDIPLLFEKEAPRWFTRSRWVSAQPGIQSERVLGRPGMTPASLRRSWLSSCLTRRREGERTMSSRPAGA
jgi:dephospho-CoA kinase